jgi:hypothetical protein
MELVQALMCSLETEKRYGVLKVREEGRVLFLPGLFLIV